MNNPKPILGDGDGEEEYEFDSSQEGEIPREVYWTDNIDEIRRFYIFEKMADPDINGKDLVENMDLIYKWCVNGSLPSEKPKPAKLHNIKSD